MNLLEAIKALTEGKRIRRKTWEITQYVQFDEDGKLRDNTGSKATIIIQSNPIKNDDFEIVEEPLLDQQEKKYLENLLRPYTKRYEKILIKKTSEEEEGCSHFHILITFYVYAFKDDTDYADYASLPYFDADDMYVGMEAEKFYTLDELGLFKK